MSGFVRMILDMCCGMGNFFNHLPNLHNAYGFDIDGKAVAVARYLYPDAHIESAISGSITQNNALTPLSAIRLSI